MRFPVNARGGAARLDRRGTMVLFFTLTAVLVINDAVHAGLWFDDPVSYSVPKTPRGLSVGHLNDDPYLDVFVAATTTNSATGYIYLNDGFGGLVPGPTVAIVPGYERHALGDFNGDGRTDIAVSGSPTRVYYASAAYTYPGPAVLVPLDAWPNGYFGEMRAEDLDQDGHCDLIGRPGNEGPQQPYLWIVWGGPTGLVPGNTQIEIDLVDDISCEPSLYSSVIGLAVADADVDGDLDIVVSAVRDWGIEDPPCERRGIGVIWCDGPRVYRESEEWTVKEQDPTPVSAFYDLQVSRLGADSHVDLLCLAATGLVLYGDGVGSWRAPEPSGLQPVPARILDVDGDDVADALQLYAGSVRVYRGLPVSGFQLLESLPEALALGASERLDQDEKPDVVAFGVNPNRVSVLMNVAPIPVSVQTSTGGWRLRARPSVTAGRPVWLEQSLGGDRGESPRSQRSGSVFFVRDIQGRTVWHTPHTVSDAAGLWWDLKDLRGERVPAGVYFVGRTGEALEASARVHIVR